MASVDYTRGGERFANILSAKTQQRIFLLALVAVDVVALWVAFGFAYGFRFALGLEIFETSITTLDYYIRFMAVLVPLWLVLFFFVNLYNLRYLLIGTQEYARIVNACTLAMMILVVATFFGRFLVARGWLVLFWVFSILCVGLFRFGVRRIVYALRRRGLMRTKTLVVGADGEGCDIARQLKITSTCGAEVIGFLDDGHAVGDMVDGVPVLGPVAAIKQIVSERGVEEVLLSTSGLTRTQIIDIYQILGGREDVELRLSLGLYEILASGARIKEWGAVPLVSINKVRLSEMETWVKTTIDYTLTLSGLVFLAPFLLFLAILVKCDTPGPVLHRRRVLGRNGREFDAFKFRTMLVDGDEILTRYPELVRELQENHKLKNDPRITRVGRWLRKYSLDELPQLINVLLGQMSLVGPRMISPSEADKYGTWKMSLFTVRPGITGLWQISGRSDVTYEERVRLDMHYIRNYTFWLDFMILFRTIPAVLRGRGAY